MRVNRARVMRAMTLVAGLLLGLAAATAPAALVTVSGSETWDGTANPHAADGVTLTTNTTVTPNVFIYTIPDGMRITAGGSVNLGSSGNAFVFAFTGGNLQIDPGGASITADSVSGGGDIRNAFTASASAEYGGTRELLITNVNHVTLDTLSCVAEDATHGPLRVVAAGKVTVNMLDNSDPNAGGSSARDITVRASQIDVRTVSAYVGRTTGTMVNGDILLEALAPPAYDPQLPIQTKANTLVARGLIRTRGGSDAFTKGSVTLRAAVLTLETGFATNIAPSGIYANFAGDATPESTYFVVLSNNGTFTATHNVQLKPPPGTMIAIR